MVQNEPLEIRKTIRRHQLREMVPLADSTIYEMEQRGEFPRRFALSPRCIVWDLRLVTSGCCARGIGFARRASNQAWTSARSQTMQRGDSAKRRGNSPRCSIS